MHSITDAEFESHVLRSAKPVVVKFTGEGWPGCTIMAPVLEQVAKETAGRAEVFEMDIARTDTYVRFGVSGIPTLIFFKNGKEIGRLIGVVKKDKILEKLT